MLRDWVVGSVPWWWFLPWLMLAYEAGVEGAGCLYIGGLTSDVSSFGGTRGARYHNFRDKAHFEFTPIF